MKNYKFKNLNIFIKKINFFSYLGHNILVFLLFFNFIIITTNYQLLIINIENGVLSYGAEETTARLMLI